MKTVLILLLTFVSSANAMDMIHLNGHHEIIRPETGWRVYKSPNNSKGVVMEKELSFPDTMEYIDAITWIAGTPENPGKMLLQFINIDNPNNPAFYWSAQSNQYQQTFEKSFPIGIHTFHRLVMKVMCVPPNGAKYCFGYIDFIGRGSLQNPVPGL